MSEPLLEVSVIIPTAERGEVLRRTLHSLFAQSQIPAEVIVVDASATFSRLPVDTFPVPVIHEPAKTKGAAHQRVQGLASAHYPIVWFLDDDVVLEEECTARLYKGMQSAEEVGAVNAMITNQRYEKPGRLSRWMYILMSGHVLTSYAGKVIGPAWNLLPEDDPALPEYVACEWLNTTCTMYRRSAFPSPLFPGHFTGYSMFEDLALSCQIGQTHRLLNARTARIYHDSQPGTHKDNVRGISEMALVNRYWVMTRVLHRTGFVYAAKLFVLELFGIASLFRTRSGIKRVPNVILGKFSGLFKLRELGSTV